MDYILLKQKQTNKVIYVYLPHKVVHPLTQFRHVGATVNMLVKMSLHHRAHGKY